MSSEWLSIELTRSQFEWIGTLLHESCGIRLNRGKESLVKSRLAKRLRALGLSSFEDYIDLLERDSTHSERRALIDALTTNKTSFFREPQHFTYLRNRILPPLAAEDRRIRIWSAGCSTGEEPYSIAILLREALPDIDRRDSLILATDISTRVLDRAREGIYAEAELQDVPPRLIQGYFHRMPQPDSTYSIKDAARKLVRFARLNLMADWPMKGPFDVIFCRNVMIYFDKAIQMRLVERFWQHLEAGGHLFVGHSESLTASSNLFRYVQPATYVK